MGNLTFEKIELPNFERYVQFCAYREVKDLLISKLESRNVTRFTKNVIKSNLLRLESEVKSTIPEVKSKVPNEVDVQSGTSTSDMLTYKFRTDQSYKYTMYMLNAIADFTYILADYDKITLYRVKKLLEPNIEELKEKL